MKQVLYKVILFMLFSTSIFGKTLPKGPLAKVHYRTGSQMSRFPDADLTVLREGDEIHTITFEIDSRSYVCYKMNDADLMDKLRRVIEQYKMQNYKKSYVNRDCLDGWSWSFEAQFYDENGTISYQKSISSYGSNDGPRDGGRKAIRETIEESLKNADRLYTCDKNGEEIPDIPWEMRECMNDIDYLAINRNDYDGRVEVRFYDQDSQAFKNDFPDTQVSDRCMVIKTGMKYCYGGMVVGTGRDAVLYLIMQFGRVERIPIANMAKSQLETTGQTKESGICKVQYVKDRKGHDRLCGIDKEGNTIHLTWQHPLPDPNEKPYSGY